MDILAYTQPTRTMSIAGSVYEYQYRTMSISHLPQLQGDIDCLTRDGQLSDAKTFQAYMNELAFKLPEDFQDAQSIIVVAIFIQPMIVHFQYNDTRIPAAMPPNYYDIGMTGKVMSDEIQKTIIRENGYHLQRANNFHLKLLAVRSGLGRYGRNNICYVDGMGSFLTLHAYLTDYRFTADHWHDLRMMDLCRDCTICMKQCPGGAIHPERFVIDVKRCLPLYN